MKSRFLNISYLLNTVIIKIRGLLLRVTRGAYPYDYFKDRTDPVEDQNHVINRIDAYHSLTYLNYEKALKHHSGDRSITQDLIIGLVYYNELIKNPELDVKYLIELASELKERGEESDNGLIFYINEPYEKFGLEGKYYSGIVQGKASSFFLRCYTLTKEDRFKEWAKKCLLGAWKSTETKGVLRILSNNQIWVEEYPSAKPSMVLNGFLFYLIGLADYLSVEKDEVLIAYFEMSLNSVLAWMPNYRLKNGLLYSMYRWNYCNVHYSGIMKYQFEHLYQLTGLPMFKKFSNFTNNLTNWRTFDQIT